jgi:hypothetical protein
MLRSRVPLLGRPMPRYSAAEGCPGNLGGGSGLLLAARARRRKKSAGRAQRTALIELPHGGEVGLPSELEIAPAAARQPVGARAQARTP